MSDSDQLTGAESFAIAVVGMAGRFPGADGVEQFWCNLRDGVESITFFTDRELEQLGVAPETIAHPDFVGASPALKNVDQFDASFFGYSPQEAATLDPQQRHFLECAWEAIEDAGYNPETYNGLIGVYAGSGTSGYLLFNLLTHPDYLAPDTGFAALMGNTQDFLSTRIAYKLNLRGPAVTVQTACSTSLVATHLACQSLLDYQCDMALAGGVSITPPQRTGYIYQKGGIFSPDGHCRAFDAQAQGTVFGSGVGIIVLKRLEDAQCDGDHIYAVIRGSAINNDGGLKTGYTAPSVTGQSHVISAALAAAGVDPSTIRYVEAHGTGTALGDPIEVAALIRVFGAITDAKQWCALGSAKTNVGHLDAAAGVAGLIKVVKALQHKRIPPSLHFTEPNPEIDFAGSPFFVNTELAEWPAGQEPRRAGLSSFGLGGTNVHIVLEEASPAKPSDDDGPWQLLPLSAKTASALSVMSENLADDLVRYPECNFADVAYTLQVGRKPFEYRQVAVVHDREDAINILKTRPSERVITTDCTFSSSASPVVFMFPGGGAQHVGMASELYESEPVFRECIDHCAELLSPHLESDLQQIILYGDGSVEGERATLERPSFALPALFAVEYALAKLWMSWGIQPRALIGHSLGEYVAACLAGVIPLENALALVSLRGRLFEKLPVGGMLAVQLSEESLRLRLGEQLSIAAVNSPSFCVVSGTSTAIDEMASILTQEGVACSRLHIDVAAHSTLVTPILAEFSAFVEQIPLRKPQIPYVSNVTGDWIGDEDALRPGYWAEHLRHTVRFADGVAHLLRQPGVILLEVGPGQVLSTLARRHPERTPEHSVLSSLPHPKSQKSDRECLLNALAQLWLRGAPIDWAAIHAHERRQRVSLPTYPFERRRYWIEPLDQPERVMHHRPLQVADWFYVPVWQQEPSPVLTTATQSTDCPVTCLLFIDDCGVGAELAERLRDQGYLITTVIQGTQFERLDEFAYAINPGERKAYDLLLEKIGGRPHKILHLWNVTPPGSISLDDAQVTALDSLVFLTQALSEQGDVDALDLVVFTSNLYSVIGDEALQPEKALVVGPCRVIPLEYPYIRCQHIDLAIPPSGASLSRRLLDGLMQELVGGGTHEVIAYRGAYRWHQHFKRVELAGCDPGKWLRQGGSYLIVGGLGVVGLALAECLAEEAHAKIAFTGRSPFPLRQEWDDWLSAHDDEDLTGYRIRQLRALESLGAEVEVLQADVTDHAEMQRAIKHIRERWGEINGVIHAAAVPGVGVIEVHTPEDAARLLAPKMQGVCVLKESLRGLQPDFVILCSSISSFTGGVGGVDYASVSAHLDAFAHAWSAAEDKSTIVASVNWSWWKNAEMMLSEDIRTELQRIREWQQLEVMSPTEAKSAFRSILANLTLSPQIIVSSQDFSALVRKSRIYTTDYYMQKLEETSRSGRARVHSVPHSTYVAPRNALEREIATMWQDLLGVQRVGIHDNFFELGGHSLLGLRLIAHIRERYQVELSLRALFEASTIAEMAMRVEGHDAGQRDSFVPLLTPRGREVDIPLSYAQEQLWFMDQLVPDSPSFNISAVVRLEGPLDIAALARTFQEILQRHEVLHTSFSAVGGQPVQKVVPLQEVRLPVLDLQEIPWEKREAEAKWLATAEARYPFNLADSPLMRMALLHLRVEEYVLLVTMHHIVSDGWSVRVLMQEMATLYEAFSSGLAAQLPPLPVQYADFAVWQREWLQGKVLENQLAYWKQQLQGMPAALRLPVDHPRPPFPTFQGALERFTLPQSLSQALKELGRQEEATFFMALLAAFKTLLYRYTAQEDMVMGGPIANRDRAEVAGLIGLFVNTLVLRTDLSGNPTFRELLRRVRQVVLEAYAHQDVPFEMVVQAVKPGQDLSRNPLVQVVLVLHNAPITLFELPGLTLTPLELEAGISRVDLELQVWESPEGLEGFFMYNTDIFDPGTIIQMLERFKVVLEKVVENPDYRLLDIPLQRDKEASSENEGTSLLRVTGSLEQFDFEI